MKNLLCALLLFFAAAAFSAGEAIAEESRKDREKTDMSYAFGMVVAADLLGTGLEFNYNAFTRGLRAAMEKEETPYTMDEAMDKIQAAFAEAQKKIAERNLAEGTAFLAENGKRPGVVTTSSGLQYELVSEGGGEQPGPDDTVLVHYRGTTIDGTIFDTTYNDNEPMEIPLNGVIPGWSEGLLLMKTGGKAKLYIPPELAYGERGAGGSIGPNSVLVFDVELLSIAAPDELPDMPDTHQ